MAILRFTHGDEVRDLDVMTMLMSEAEACETLTGWTEDEWRTELTHNRVGAVRFAWFLAGRRAGAAERYSEIDLDLRKLGVEVIASEDEEPVGGDGTEEGVAADLPTGRDDSQEAPD